MDINKETLKNKEMRDMLMLDKYHYSFVWLVQDLDDYSYIADDDIDRKSVV